MDAIFIHDRLGVTDLGVVAPAAGFEAGVRELLAQQLERNAVLQRDGDGAGEAVHQAADGGAFFGHGDEDLAGNAVLVEADGDVAFVASDVELVGDRQALVGELVRRARGGPAGSSTVFDRRLGQTDRLLRFLLVLLGVEQLGLLGAVTVDGDCLEALLPGLM